MRRKATCSVLGAALGAALALAAPRAAADLFEITQVADGIFVAVRPDPLAQPVEGNVTFIITDRDVVVVDGSRTRATARAAIAALARLTDKPVRYLVNTHWHGDHHHGNSEWADAYPGLEVVSHAGTRDEIRTLGVRSLESQIEMFAARDRLQQLLDEGRDERGPLSDAMKHRLRQLLGIPPGFLEELRAVTIRPPTLVFADELTIERGDRTVRLFSHGPGNTEADVIVHVPAARVVITGDLVVSTVPFMSESRPRGWLARLREIEALDPAVIVPGHGPVERDRRWLDRHVRLLESLIAQVDGAIRDGLTLEETRRRVDLSSFRREYAGGDRMLADEFDFRVTQPAVRDAYEEARRR